MDTAERLSELLQTCAWVKDPDVALQVLPSFAEDVPALVSLPQQRSDGARAIPLSCVPAVAGPLARVLGASALPALRGTGPTVDTLRDDALLQDPLVEALRGLFARAAVPTLRAHTAPALAVGWAAQRMLAGQAGQVPGVDADEVRGVDALAQHLAGLEPGARGAALQRVGWEISGRLGAAVGAVVRAGLPLRSGGLLRTLVADRLVLAFPRGSLDREARLDEVAAMLGVGLDARLLKAVVAAARAALAASAERRRKGKAEGVDIALAAVLPGGDDAMRVLLHPAAGRLLLGSLGTLTTARDLKKAGIDGGVARDLVKPNSYRALAAGWADLAGPLRAWDLHASLVDRVVPLRKRDGRWSGPGGSVSGGARWDLLVPGAGAADTARAAVAVRLSAVRGAVSEAARGFDPSGAVRRAWMDLTSETRADVSDLTADHGVAAFATPSEAVRFALRARRALSGPREVLAGPGDARLMVPDGVQVAVGIGWGPIRGGTDGEAAALSGPAVADALAMSGAGSIEGSQHDPLAVRRAAPGRLGLHSDGLLVAPEVSAAFLQALRDERESVHLAGEGTKVAGLARDFRRYPVRGWWDAGRDGVVVFIALGDEPNAAVELRTMDADELAAFHQGDAALAERDRSPSSHAPAPDGDLGGFDPFAESVPTRASPAPDPGALQPSYSFMGASSPRSADAFAAAPGALDAAEQILSGEDTFDDFEVEDTEDHDLPEVEGDPLAVVDDGPAADDGDPWAMDDTPEAVVEGPTDWAAPAPDIGRLAMLDEGEPPLAQPEFDEDDDDLDEPRGPSAPMMLPEDGDPGPSAPMMLPDEDEPVTLPGGDGGAPSAPMIYDAEDAPEDAPTEAASPGPDFGFVAPGVASEPEVEIEDGPDVEIDDDWDDADDEDDDGDWEAAVRDSATDRSAEVGFLHGEPEPSIELVGVAGFSLQHGASRQGADAGKDPFFDSEEYTGFYDERGRDAHSRLIDAPPAMPEPDLGGAEEGLTELDPSDSFLGFSTSRAHHSDDSGDVMEALMSDQGGVVLESGGRGSFGFQAEAVEDSGSHLDDDGMLAELVRTFRGYVVFEDDGEFTFGLRDGSLVRDAHAFDTDGDAAVAYERFLQAKIGEGFVPRPDRVVALLPGAMPGPIDEGLLRAAYRAVGG